MFLDSWSLSLTFGSLLVLFLLILAFRTAVRVLRYWDPASDSNRQIKLEGETWLASTLVIYALGFQIVSLLIFLLATDHYSQVIVGAMCATGALKANIYGGPTLTIKLAGVFFYAFWIVIHRLDIGSETYPLVKLKYIYLLLPFLLTDITLQTLYIINLTPDIITSCCAVVFAEGGTGGMNLFGVFSHFGTLITFYGTAVFLAIIGAVILTYQKKNTLLNVIYSLVWGGFFLLALFTITTVFSSYIYAMPYHRCPFCILKPEYNYYGFALYLPLIIAAFFGISTALVGALGSKKELAGAISKFQRSAVKISLILLLIFTFLSSYHYLRFLILGGEG